MGSNEKLNFLVDRKVETEGQPETLRDMQNYLSTLRYDHMEGARFRHTAQFLRWRPDRTPASCTFAQLDQPVSFDLNDIVPGLR